MEIKTEYKVGDLIKHKYSSQTEKHKTALVVKEIMTQTCYAGTQVFYDCRLIMMEKEFEKTFDPGGPFVWRIGFNTENKVTRLRADEVQDLDKETKGIISKANDL